SAVFAAAAYTLLRVLGNREKFYTVVFYFSFFSTVILLPFLIIFYVPMTGEQLLYLLLVGVFASVGYFCLILAFYYSRACVCFFFMLRCLVISCFSYCYQVYLLQ